jgi:hypothetical protein
MVINLDELDIRPPGGPKYQTHQTNTSKELVETFDRNVAAVRRVLASTTEEHPMTPWRLLAGGNWRVNGLATP